MITLRNEISPVLMDKTDPVYGPVLRSGHVHRDRIFDLQKPSTRTTFHGSRPVSSCPPQSRRFPRWLLHATPSVDRQDRADTVLNALALSVTRCSKGVRCPTKVFGCQLSQVARVALLTCVRCR